MIDIYIFKHISQNGKKWKQEGRFEVYHPDSDTLVFLSDHTNRVTCAYFDYMPDVLTKLNQQEIL